MLIESIEGKRPRSGNEVWLCDSYEKMGQGRKLVIKSNETTGRVYFHYSNEEMLIILKCNQEIEFIDVLFFRGK